jgi:hypothetical protein
MAAKNCLTPPGCFHLPFVPARFSFWVRRFWIMKPKILKFVFPMVAAVFLCGCPTVHPQYLERPKPVAAQGTYVHPASKIVMPENIGDFQRGRIFRYDVAGSDESAGYNLVTPLHNVAATVYVFPAPPLVSIGSPPDMVETARVHLTENEFQDRVQEIELAHPGAVVTDQQDTRQIQGGLLYPGKFAAFEYDDLFGGDRVPLHSYLYLFCFVGDKWAVEYRFTCPEKEDCDKEIQDFIQKWNWYGTASNPAP